jgi:hypothetical protein
MSKEKETKMGTQTDSSGKGTASRTEAASGRGWKGVLSELGLNALQAFGAAFISGVGLAAGQAAFRRVAASQEVGAQPLNGASSVSPLRKVL